jgi:hypothetical protein
MAFPVVLLIPLRGFRPEALRNFKDPQESQNDSEDFVPGIRRIPRGISRTKSRKSFRFLGAGLRKAALREADCSSL